MTRCGCEANGCDCFLSGSACLAVTGAGSSASPYVLTPVVSADVDNDLSCRADGLFAAPKVKGAKIATSQTTTSLTFVDLATSGPAASLTTGAAVKVTVACQSSNNTGSDGCFMGFAVSGATTVAADDATSFGLAVGAAGEIMAGSRTTLVTGLTPGTNVFTAKYRAVVGGTATFSNREIIVERVELIP
jgi:hypothetical protein